MSTSTTRPIGFVSCLVMATAFSASVLAAQAPPSEWSAPARAARQKNPVSATPESIAAGRQLYAQLCVACHGSKGAGDGPAAAALNPRPRDLTSAVVARLPDGELRWKIRTGRAPMPGFGPVLQGDQAWDLVNYLKTLSRTSATAPVNSSEVVNPAQTLSALVRDYLRVVNAEEAPAPDPQLLTAVSTTVSSVGELSTLFESEHRSNWSTKIKSYAASSARLATAEGDQAFDDALAVHTRHLAALLETFGHDLGEDVRLFADGGADGRQWIQLGAEPRNPYVDSKRAHIGTFIKTFPSGSRVAPSPVQPNRVGRAGIGHQPR